MSADPRKTIGDAWEYWLDAYPTCHSVVVEYAFMLRDNGKGWPWFRVIDEAIVERWSPSALAYIKRRAADLVTGRPIW